ncbi:MAG: hypothetical protein KI792_02945 [Alphaproteobacteria bacterium]|nr:hypothetical protein [Alphaproteobacteria bacterium SS10]
MGQDRAFMIQANRVARLPLTASFFPEINNRNDRNGIVGVAPKAVQTELRETLVNMIKNFRHKMIHSGPPTKKPAVETAQPKAAAAEPVRPQQHAEGTTRRKTLTLR